jgi:hypothetical protein
MTLVSSRCVRNRLFRSCAGSSKAFRLRLKEAIEGVAWASGAVFGMLLPEELDGCSVAEAIIPGLLGFAMVACDGRQMKGINA